MDFEIREYIGILLICLVIVIGFKIILDRSNSDGD